MTFYEDSKNVDLNIYEINSNEKYWPLYSSLLFNCKFILFMFDVTNEQSFLSVKETIKTLSKKTKNQKIIKYLIANKIDEINARTVNESDINTYLTELNNSVDYYEISVKTKEKMGNLLRDILKIYNNSDVSTGISNDITIYESEKNNKTHSIFARRVYKIILLGDGTVGKSSFFKRYFYDDFEDNYMMTVGVNDKFKFIRIKNSVIKLQLWDTAGKP